MGCGGSKTGDVDAAANKQAATRAQGNRQNNNNNDTNQTKTSPRKPAGPQSKYVKPASSYNGSVNGSVHKDATDKGYNRRLRNNMINATQGHDIEALEQAKDKFEKNRLEDCGDLTQANERLNFLKLRRDLRDAVRRRNVGVLERTIADAEASQYAGQLASQIEAAKAELAHMRELNQYSHDILAMHQSTISELHSYHRPPACVHDVMAASYMLLGQDESSLRDWSYVQSMAGRVGRDSLIHQVRDFDSSNVDERTSKRVREIINYHELDEVRAASNGAATFHVWASNIVDKVDKDNSGQDNQNQTKPSNQNQTKPEQVEQNQRTLSKVSKGSKGSRRNQR